jgi:hypothetical protein
MARSRYALTAAVAHLIVSYVRAGGYPHVAAEAAGIPRAVFKDWMRRGAGPRGRALYRDFRRDVLQAHAQARLKAEVEMLEERPLDWLRYGPGKETAEAPGWTGPARPHEGSLEAAELSLDDPRVQEVITLLQEEFSAYPDDRSALARKFVEKWRRANQARHGPCM